MVLPGVETQVRYTGIPGVVVRRYTTGREDRVVRMVAGVGTGQRYGVHNNSLNNLLRGLAERVLFKTSPEGLVRAPQPVPDAFKRLSGVKHRLLSKLSPTPIVDLDDYPVLYSGRKKLVYERAVAELHSRGYRNSDAEIRAFVKAEKINFSAKADPAPRIIQPRSPVYNVMVGRYLKKFEKRLFKGFKSAFGYDVVLKGLNADGVGRALEKHWSHFTRPVAVGLDASRFDQHVSVPALEFEHSVYNSVFRSPELAKLLKAQLKNRGLGLANDGRVRYTTEGGRMSGDINTGMGNCLLMSCMVLGYLERYGVDARLANNGDDCVLFLESDDLYKLRNLSSWFLDFGFVLTQEEPVYCLEQVEFCQSHPVWVGDGYRMVRDIRTAPAKDMVSLLGWDNEANFNAWRDAVSVCGQRLTSGVPVWERFYGALDGGRAKSWALDRVEDSGFGYMAKDVKQSAVSQRGRYSFYLAFGMLPDQQEALEEAFTSVPYHEPRPMTFADVSVIKSDLQLWLENGITKPVVTHGPALMDF